MKVSVIIPCYNAEKFIKQAIESVFNQTFEDYEIILVDDASTDKSLEIIKEYAKIKGIRYFKNEENRGIGFTRARGVKEAKGEYLCFLSADDLFMPDYLENMLKYSEHGLVRGLNKKSFLFSDYFIINENGAITRQFNAPRFENYEDFILHCILQAKVNNMFVCYNLFGPTKLFKENNFDSSCRYGEDLMHLLYCLLVKKIKFKHIPIPLFKYRLHQKMVTQQKLQEIAGNNQLIFQKINAIFKKKYGMHKEVF